MKPKKGKIKKKKKKNPLHTTITAKQRKKKLTLEAEMAIICNQCQSITALTEGKIQNLKHRKFEGRGKEAS